MLTIEAMRSDFIDAPALGGGRNIDVLDEVCGNPHKPNPALWGHLEVMGAFGRPTRAVTFADAFRACCLGGVRDWATFNLAGLQDCHPELRRLQLPAAALEQAADEAWREYQGPEVYGYEEPQTEVVGWMEPLTHAPEEVHAPTGSLSAAPSIPPPLPPHAWRPATTVVEPPDESEFVPMLRAWCIEALERGQWAEAKRYANVLRSIDDACITVDETLIESTETM